MLVGSISAVEISIAMLDDGCCSNDAEHTFANFPDAGKAEYMTRTLIMNLDTGSFLGCYVLHSSQCTTPA